MSNVYLFVHKNLGTAAREHRAHGFISYWSSGVDHTWRPASLNYGRTTRGQKVKLKYRNILLLHTQRMSQVKFLSEANKYKQQTKKIFQLIDMKIGLANIL